MTYYAQQVNRLQQKLYPKTYWVKQVMLAKAYMDRNCTGQVDLSRVAREACFSKFHFIRLFSSLYGCTPHQYLTGKRMAIAKKLLQHGESAGTVCLAVGFESASSFTAVFKKYTGQTPSAFLPASIRKS